MFKIFSLFAVCWQLATSFTLNPSGQPSLERTPQVLYLTWIHDPTTTMTIQWHTKSRDLSSLVWYRKVGESTWELKRGIYAQLPSTKLLVHTVELNELEPGGEYEFSLVGKKGAFRFKTLPSVLTKPVKFVIGGDAYRYYSTFRKMNRQVAATDPDFVVVGGDIAYTNGFKTLFQTKGWQVKRWRTFLKQWKSQMVTSDGRMIPLVPALGNHDIRSSSLKSRPVDTLFYELFALPEKGISYRALDVGNYLSLVLLDTDHHYHISGQQTAWLEKTLSQRERVAYKMAVYHVGAYPSVYPFLGKVPEKIRTQWSPLFEKYDVGFAFEHHNHAYKRTYPLKAGKIDPAGVIYMGDGSWGVNPRKTKKIWYLEKAERVNAVCLVTLSQESSRVDAIDLQGKVIDSVTTFPKMH